MKVFISWSGEPSRQIAFALRDWLPMVLQAVELYMSEQDNEAGGRWQEVIARELSDSDFGIVCLTPANVAAPWLHFEAGALGKAVDGHVVPLLYKLAKADVGPPLSMFQMKLLDRAGVHDTLKSINRRLDKPRDEKRLSRLFGLVWPELQERLDSLVDSDTSGQPVPHRADRELLEEILQLVRTRQPGYGSFDPSLPRLSNPPITRVTSVSKSPRRSKLPSSVTGTTPIKRKTRQIPPRVGE